MKTRVLSALSWGSLAIITIFFIYSPLLVIFVSFVSLIAANEILKAAGVKNIPILVLSHALAAVIPFVIEYDLLNRFSIPTVSLAIFYVVGLLCLMLMQYEKTKFEHVAMALVASAFVPYALSAFILVRDLYKAYPGSVTRLQALYFFFMGIVCSWMTDAYAYFVGSKLGKHKLSPKISPKKSVEGAIGGVILTLILNLVVLFFFNRFYLSSPISVFLVIPLSIFLSVVGMLGDLSASVIKRNYGLKDFGTIMKGHGGAMDRFDSCIFVFPVLYAGFSLIKVFV
ncbi:MAG TPA: CDP-archaeol synthase [Clostridiales bacterium]|nr:CDP-archaeol synthase [Clostridiales bacterium]